MVTLDGQEGSFPLVILSTASRSTAMASRPINMAMKLRIREIRLKRGMTIAQLADAIDKTPGYISMVERGANRKRPSTELLADIADALDVPSSSLLSDLRPVPVVGHVGAGAAVELTDAYAKGDGMYHVACPEDLPARDVVAVEVTGQSMEPMIQPGDILFFTRHFIGVDERAVSNVAICETADGRALVKLVRPGRDKGTFDLYSINSALNGPEYGLRLRWAAPFRRHIRKEDVERI